MIAGKYLYEASFSNVGGLVMPIIAVDVLQMEPLKRITYRRKFRRKNETM